MRKLVHISVFLSLLAMLSFATHASSGRPLYVGSAPVAVASAGSKFTRDKVSINSADASTLQRELAGIGKAKAKAIVAYRNSHGRFHTLDELLEVKGIGTALLERNRDRLKLD